MPTAPEPPEVLALALVEEACRKSSILWLRPPGQKRSVAAWHAWADGGAYVVSGGREQDLPPLPHGATVLVTVRSKDKGDRLVTWSARAVPLVTGSPEWEHVVPELHAKRLNPPDGEAQPLRWAAESTITRLEPTGELVEAPGRISTDSHAAAPPESPATTRGRLPFVVGRRARRRRG